MEAFIAQPVDRITYPPRTDPGQLLAERERRMGRRSLMRRAEEDLYVMKMLRWLFYSYRSAGSAAMVASRPRWPFRYE